MFCGKCGKEITDDTKFCKYCGNPVTARKPSPAPAPSPGNTHPKRYLEGFPDCSKPEEPSSSAPQSSSSESSNAFLNTIAKIALVFSLLFFCCPFVMVSCSGESAEVSGVEVMLGKEFGDDELMEDDTPANAFLIFAFLAGAGALGFTFADKTYRTKGVAVLTAVSTLGTVAFRTNFFDYYKELQGYESYIQFRWGWTMTLLAYIVAFLCALLQYLNDKMQN